MRISKIGFGLVGLAGLLALGAGCAGEDSSDDSESQATAEAISVGDILDTLEDVGQGVREKTKDALCGALRIGDIIGDQAVRSGVFYGVTAEADAAGLAGYVGQDYVWDLYHHQYTVSHYKGAGLVTEIAAVSVQPYVGVAFGWDTGVWNWDGYFVEGSVNVSLPFLKQYLSGGGSGFLTAIDKNKDKFITPNEVQPPRTGAVYGVAANLAIGVGVPTGLPASVEVNQGLWKPYNKGIKSGYTRMKNKGIPVHLVNTKNEECPEAWPNVAHEPGHNEVEECVVEVGSGSDHSKRNRDVAKAICLMTDGCLTPFGQGLAASAVMEGMLHDLRKSQSRFGDVISNRKLERLLKCDTSAAAPQAKTFPPAKHAPAPASSGNRNVR